MAQHDGRLRHDHTARVLAPAGRSGLRMMDIGLVGSNSLAREGLRLLLEQHQLKVSSHGVHAVDSPDWNGRGETRIVLIIDPADRSEVLDLVGRLTESDAEHRVVVLADAFDFAFMTACFAAGADGFVVKEISCEPLVAALQMVACGEKVMPSALIECLSGERARPMLDGEAAQAVRAANLSERERDVLRCLVAGQPNKVISHELDISEATVKVHVKSILRKLKVTNRTQAALLGSMHA